MGVSTDVHMKDKIELSELEKKIFNRLLDVVRHFNLDTQLRVAGGWVRDKLLGKDCYDIDIALDNMLGREFCEKVNEYLSYTGEEQQGVGVIQCNPDQSKHLETARMRILDTWVDFVNLRSESYVENSRIPTMKFGTAEEDACRRDLTINSLFYNINTDLVEDLTGRGISDLQSGLIVTPLPPKLTFLDDPLRVLRAIRFGARFEFKLDKDLKEAASDEEVKVALADKISRERIGHEINLMISCHHPVAAIISICDLELFWIIFRLPHNHEPEITEGADRLCLRYIDAAWNIMQSVGLSSLNDEYRRIGLYGALFLPLKDILYADKKDKKFPVVNHIIRYSLKLKARDADMVMSLHDASEKFISLIPFIISSEEFSSYETELEDEYRDFPLPSRKRIMAGLVLWQIKGLWRTALLLSTLLYPNLSQIDDFLEMQQEFHKRVELFKRVENVIIELGLEKVWETKPLLDGRAIMSALHLKAGGPQVKEWQEKMFKWHFAHPSGTPDECIDWIKQSSSKRLKLTDNGDGASDLTHS